MSCGFPAHSLPHRSYLIPGWLQFPPEKLSCRWCLSNNNRCHSRAKANLLAMCGSCNASLRRDPGPEEEPWAWAWAREALGGLAAATPPLAQLTRGGPQRCRGV